jgi:hypothetical protein
MPRRRRRRLETWALWAEQESHGRRAYVFNCSRPPTTATKPVSGSSLRCFTVSSPLLTYAPKSSRVPSPLTPLPVVCSQ